MRDGCTPNYELIIERDLVCVANHKHQHSCEAGMMLHSDAWQACFVFLPKLLDPFLCLSHATCAVLLFQVLA
jgi:hypothetical protein